MTLASNVAQLTEDALDTLDALRADLREVTDAQHADRFSYLRALIGEAQVRALDVLDDEDHAPLTQEEVTRP